MAHQISPQEFHLLVDNPIVRTKCPQDQITDAMIVKRVKNGNLIAGDIVRVQCMNSDYTDLLAECEYRVISRKSELVTHEINDRDIRQVEQITYRVERWTEWREVGGRSHEILYGGPAGGEMKPERYIEGADIEDAQAVWNVGSRGYDIIVNEDKIGFHKDKDIAIRIAAGELPLPETA